MIAAMEVRPDETSSYGIFRTTGFSIGRSVPVSGMVEKPAPGQAPSRLAAVGRYILDPCIFATLQHVTARCGRRDPVDRRDRARCPDRVSLSAFRFSGTRYDCGSHDGLLDAAIARQARSGTCAAGVELPAASMAGQAPVARI
jgi:UTP--glucose-1-phosphate uridylyltransferase